MNSKFYEDKWNLFSLAVIKFPIILLLVSGYVSAQKSDFLNLDLPAQSVLLHYNKNNETYPLKIVDTSHYSNVFGEIRKYRVFFPLSYFTNLHKRYPVIYFLHGWSQRYFGSVGDNYASYDSGIDNNGDNIESFVKNNDVIVVKLDGYDRSQNEKFNIRPYNIGQSSPTYRQFVLYFPEIVSVIDRTLRSKADRNHRAISGLSMGGFMAFWIAGKFPDLVAVTGSFCGSSEFEVGPVDMPVEYRHSDMYKNYEHTRVRLHYGDRDFVRSYHQDLNKNWAGVLPHYSYKEYNSDHSVCGMKDMFGFFVSSFEKPIPNPARWNHIDLYPNFNIWNYNITSDRNIPGFTILENVSKRGFNISVRRFIPNGEFINYVKTEVVTAPIYERNQIYNVKIVNAFNKKVKERKIKADDKGKLSIKLDGSYQSVYISKYKNTSQINFVSYKIYNQEWVQKGEKIKLGVALNNIGFNDLKNIKLSIKSACKSVEILKTISTIDLLQIDSVEDNYLHPFEFIISSDTLKLIRFQLKVSSFGNDFQEFSFEVPIWSFQKEKVEFMIADGKVFTVAKAGIDSAKIFLGMGNGDGVANPGESIVILVKDSGRNYRTEVSADQFINSNGENERKTDNWFSYDFGGASAKYSVPVISSFCPDGHIIRAAVKYLRPTIKPNHISVESLVEFTVRGLDKTPPAIAWYDVSANNTLLIKFLEGSRVKKVKVFCIPYFQDTDNSFSGENKQQVKEFQIELNDSGVDGDILANDGVFSFKIAQTIFCAYKIRVESYDLNKNKSSLLLEKTIYLY